MAYPSCDKDMNLRTAVAAAARCDHENKNCRLLHLHAYQVYFTLNSFIMSYHTILRVFHFDSVGPFLINIGGFFSPSD